MTPARNSTFSPTDGIGHIPVSAPESQEDASLLSSLAKGLAALDLLREKRELGTNELAGLMQINKSAASRILRTLASAGYAERIAGRRYRLVDLFGPPSRSLTSVRSLARPLLEELAHTINEAIYLGLFVDGQVLYVDKVVPESTLKVDRPIPTFSPLYCTAIGKVFVAFDDLPIPPSLPPHTVKTIVDQNEYKQQMKQITRKGFAWDDEELHIGVRCVAAPLFSQHKTVDAVICVAAPTARLPAEDIDHYGAAVRTIAAKYTA